MKICLECLQKQKPWVSEDMAILSVHKGQCSECGEDRQLVCVYTEKDTKLLEYQMGLGTHFNNYDVIYPDKRCSFTFGDCFDELEITLKTLVVNLGWDRVRDNYMYVKGQEEGKPIAFRTPKEYDPYLNYRAVKIDERKKEIIIEPKLIDEL